MQMCVRLKKNKQVIESQLLACFVMVIPLGFEPKTHSLEGCCSNPTELRNQQSAAKLLLFPQTAKLFS